MESFFHWLYAQASVGSEAVFSEYSDTFPPPWSK